MYGIVPRAIAWTFCALMFRRKKMRLDIKQPYYQKILNFWQRHVVDVDDFQEVPAPIAPKATVSVGKKLVALLEYPSDNPNWWQLGLNKNDQNNEVENFGIVDDRDDMARLKTYLDSHPVQVLLGIHNKALPDRGTLRKIDQIASHAKNGLIVQLLNDPESKNTVAVASQPEPDVRFQQWQTALSARKIGLVDVK